jgi:hypothetical protein
MGAQSDPASCNILVIGWRSPNIQANTVWTVMQVHGPEKLVNLVGSLLTAMLTAAARQTLSWSRARGAPLGVPGDKPRIGAINAGGKYTCGRRHKCLTA